MSNLLLGLGGQLGPDAGIVLRPVLAARALSSCGDLNGPTEFDRYRPFATGPPAHIRCVSANRLRQRRLAPTLFGKVFG